jgi:hypothetical protein
MAAPTFPWPRDKQNVYNWGVPVLGYDATTNQLVPLAVGPTGALLPLSTAVAPERAYTITDAIKDGEVPPGSRTISFGLSHDFVGSIAGREIDNTKPHPVLSISPLSAPPGETLAAIPYTRKKGTITIYRIA